MEKLIAKYGWNKVIAVGWLVVLGAIIAGHSLLHDPKEEYIEYIRRQGRFVSIDQYGARGDSCGDVKAYSKDTAYHGRVCCNNSGRPVEEACALNWLRVVAY